MLEPYFEPLDPEILGSATKELPNDCLGKWVKAYTAEGHFPDFDEVRIAIIGVGEDRGSTDNPGCAGGADAIRNKFYRLKTHLNSLRMIDLGNIRRGYSLEDSYAAIATVVSELVPLKIIPIILGGSQDLTYGQYAGYKKLEQIINIVSIDAHFDLGKPEDPINSDTFLGKIILEQPNYLFNFSNIGYQTYFVGNESVELMKKLFFDIFRLGQVRENIEETEPLVRNADMVTFDISCVRQSDAPGNAMASPNGFYGEEICQIAYYAGMSDKLSSIGFYEFNPSFDRNDQTAHLLAQTIWYFIEGVSGRKLDVPLNNPNNYITYRVAVENLETELTFIKSVKSDRWWMKLPLDATRNRYMSHHLLPCSYKDYQQACTNEVPDRLWNALQKIV
ncbi:formimidoylglutamase [soil metagenome]